MLDIKFIKENQELVKDAIKNKNIKAEIDFDVLIGLYEKRLQIKKDIDELNRQKNEAAKTRNIEEGIRIKNELSNLDPQLETVTKEFMTIMGLLPNIPSADTPIGPDESGNQVIRNWGTPKQFDFTPKEHFDLGRALGVIDTETATEVSGSRFAYLKGGLALMQFALVQHVFSILTNEEIIKNITTGSKISVPTKPFVPVVPPVMIRPAVYSRMDRLEPKEERYYIPSDDIYLIGSAEHTMGSMHMDHIFEEDELPIRYIGYSTAFRREAGAAGKDTKGILRVHQFDKLEMETFCLPEQSIQEQELLVAMQEHFLQTLNLPYQVVLICTGDMGKPDYRQIDIETWMPGQNRYRETHTADLMTSFQARRLNTRVRRKDGTIEPVHMNDATACAIGRLLIAIMENYQNADGTITVPEVLVPHLGGMKVISK